MCCDGSVTTVVHLVSCSLLKYVPVYGPETNLGVHMLPVLPFVTSLRTRLLALHLLEVVLPSSGNEADRQHLQQVSVPSVVSMATVASVVSMATVASVVSMATVASVVSMATVASVAMVASLVLVTNLCEFKI